MTKVSDWMTPNPITIDADCSIIEAIHQMKEKKIRRLPVIRNNRFTGVITDRMIMEYTPSKATSLDTWEVNYLLAKTPVSEAMNPRPFTVTPDTPLLEAARIIRDNKLYGVCVVEEGGNLVGILTTTDILEALIALCPKN